MSKFTIDRLFVPRSLDDADAHDFIEMARVRNAVEEHGYGTAEVAFSAAELLPFWQNSEFEPKQGFIARVDGEVVARAVYEYQPVEDSDTAWLSVQVLPAFRGIGIGTALADEVERAAASDGRSKFIVYTVSRDAAGERIAAPTGFGSVPASNPEVRFLLGRGYALEQVERGSRLPLPVDQKVLDHLLAEATTKAGSDYVVHTWVDSTPEQWLEDVALLLTRMGTDAPSAGLEEPEDVYTVERVRDADQRMLLSPRTALTAAVEHVPSGRLVGFTVLSAPSEPDRAVAQEDTLVLREHRGHNLGMLLKVANIINLQQQRPELPSITTFNAEENRHMLSVNEAVGFVPMGYEGAWKKVL